MQYYSFPYSLMVVERFLKVQPRGWACIRNNLDNFYVEDLVQLFQTDQKKWNILKKIIKLVEKTWRPNYYTDVKLRELYQYFWGLAGGTSAKCLVDTFSRTGSYY